MPLPLRVASVVVTFALSMLARTAWAGCPRVCQITGGDVTLVPALACAQIAAPTDTCDCGVFVTLSNRCTTPIDAVGFTFTNCVFQGSLVEPCPAVGTNMQASIPLRSMGTGPQTWVLKLQNQGTDYTATMTANVTGYGAGCALAPGGSGAEKGSAYGLLALLGVLFTRTLGSSRGLRRASPWPRRVSL